MGGGRNRGVLGARTRAREIVGLIAAFDRLHGVMHRSLDQRYVEEADRALNDPKTNPMSWKKALASRIVRMYHGPDAAERAQADFEKQFSRREAPSEMPTVSLSPGKFRARDLMMKAFPNEYTATQAGSMFKQGAVFVNGDRVTDLAAEIELGGGAQGLREVVFKVGRKYARVIPGP